MEIEIYKYNSATKTSESEFLQIENYKHLSENTSLLLVIESEMGLNDEETAPFTQIFKIQFIAACKTKFKDKILVAFYSGEFGVLNGFILSDLPTGYSQTHGCVIDYKSYVDICEITKETKLSFTEYYQKIKSGVLDLNTFIKHTGKYLNVDEQQKL